MSFEGWYQCLCKQGHFSTDSIWLFDEEEWRCPSCKEGLGWWNLVDDTNCEADGEITLTVKHPPVYCTCSDCGNKHQVVEATYEFPEDVGHRWNGPQRSL